MIKHFLHERRLLYSTWLISMSIGLGLLLSTHKGDVILWFNQFYTPASVSFFTFFTRMGEWAGFLLPFVYLLVFKPIRFQIGHLMVGILTLLLVLFFKQIIYPDAWRPIVFFEHYNIELINRPEIPLNRKHSFPSGHTTAGFAYFFYAALCANKRIFAFTFFAIAFLIGLSRIFLAQHFLADVVAGSTLGVAIATTVYYFFIFKQQGKTTKLDNFLFRTNA